MTLGKIELCVQKNPGQLLPAGLGKIAVDVIAQIAAVRCKRPYFLLDHLVEAVDLFIQIRTGLVADHQFFEIPAQIIGVQPHHPALGVRVLIGQVAFLPQIGIDVGDHTADGGLHPGRIRTPAQQDISPILLKLFPYQRRFDSIQGTQQTQGKIIETDSDR